VFMLGLLVLSHYNELFLFLEGVGLLLLLSPTLLFFFFFFLGLLFLQPPGLFPVFVVIIKCGEGRPLDWGFKSNSHLSFCYTLRR